MARKPRRKFRRYLKGQIDEEQGLNALATKTGVKRSVADTVVESCWCTSVHASWSISQWTPTEDAGPIMVGIAHSDYTLAEIEEWIENADSWNQGDLRSQEIARRKIRRVGLLEWPSGTNPNDIYSMNDGRMIRTKCGWMLETGQTIALWYYNTGEAAVASSVPNVHTQGHANLWPA